MSRRHESKPEYKYNRKTGVWAPVNPGSSDDFFEQACGENPSSLMRELQALKDLELEDETEVPIEKVKSPKSPLATGVKKLVGEATQGVIKGVRQWQKLSPKKLMKKKSHDLSPSPPEQIEGTSYRQTEGTEYEQAPLLPPHYSELEPRYFEDTASAQPNPQVRRKKKRASQKVMSSGEDVVDTGGMGSKSKTSPESLNQFEMAERAQASRYDSSESESSDGNTNTLSTGSTSVSASSEVSTIPATSNSPKRIAQKRNASAERRPEKGEDTVDMPWKMKKRQSCEPQLMPRDDKTRKQTPSTSKVQSQVEAVVTTAKTETSDKASGSGSSNKMSTISSEDPIHEKTTVESPLKTVASQTSLPEEPAPSPPKEVPASPDLESKPSKDIEDMVAEFYVLLNKISDIHQTTLKSLGAKSSGMSRAMHKSATRLDALILHYREKDLPIKREIEELQKDVATISNFERRERQRMEAIKDLLKKVGAAFNEMIDAI